MPQRLEESLGAMTGNLRQRAIGLGLILIAAWLAWSLVSRYSPPDPYRSFLAPTHEFLRAGLAGDSAALVRLGVAEPALRWALDTGRSRPGLLRDLETGLHVAAGMRNGDRTVVMFKADSLKRCDEWPLTVFFSGAGTAARIEDAKAGC